MHSGSLPSRVTDHWLCERYLTMPPRLYAQRWWSLQSNIVHCKISVPRSRLDGDSWTVSQKHRVRATLQPWYRLGHLLFHVILQIMFKCSTVLERSTVIYNTEISSRYTSLNSPTWIISVSIMQHRSSYYQYTLIGRNYILEWRRIIIYLQCVTVFSYQIHIHLPKFMANALSTGTNIFIQ